MICSSDDYIVIRGVRLDFDGLVNRDFLKPNSIQDLRNQFQNAKPFPYLVLDHLFDKNLLDLVYDEFDLFQHEDWNSFKSKSEQTFRSPPKPKFGSATQLYFSIINSGCFIELLSQVTGVENLIPDPQFYGGGLHETRNGGQFEIHIDFDKHHKTLLDNEMVFITYLNKGWKSSWNGTLELWDFDTCTCSVEVLPIFGRSVIVRHGSNSLHGHPRPLSAPAGTARRSVTAYYFTNRQANQICHKRNTTLFFKNGKARRSEIIWRNSKDILPNAVLRTIYNAKLKVKCLLPESAVRIIRRIRR